MPHNHNSEFKPSSIGQWHPCGGDCPLTKCDRGKKPNGDLFFIPRITILPSKDFILKQKQFPVKLAYCLTINRAGGQTLDSIGLDLSSPCFSHGQFYVGISSTREPANIYVLSNSDLTANPVYTECLELVS